MPHITIECSDNVGRLVKLDELAERVHRAALETGTFPIGGTRTRVAERTVYRIADGHPDNAFVHVVLRIGQGRDHETKHRAGSAVFEDLCDFLQPVFESRPLAISLEVQEIDTSLRFNKNNVHEYVEERRTAKL